MTDDSKPEALLAKRLSQANKFVAQVGWCRSLFKYINIYHNRPRCLIMGSTSLLVTKYGSPLNNLSLMRNDFSYPNWISSIASILSKFAQKKHLIIFCLLSGKADRRVEEGEGGPRYKLKVTFHPHLSTRDHYLRTSSSWLVSQFTPVMQPIRVLYHTARDRAATCSTISWHIGWCNLYQPNDALRNVARQQLWKISFPAFFAVLQESTSSVWGFWEDDIVPPEGEGGKQEKNRQSAAASQEAGVESRNARKGDKQTFCLEK